MGNWSRHDTRAVIEAATERPIMASWVVRTIRKHHGENGIVEKMARLEMFLTDQGAHVWGVSDCSLRIADWVALNGHPDPGADWRCTYDSEASCKSLLEARGGLVAHIADCADQIGLEQPREPEFGCIGVIGSPHNPARQWAAIWQGFRWLVWSGDERSAQWVPFTAKYLAMWRV